MRRRTRVMMVAGVSVAVVIAAVLGLSGFLGGGGGGPLLKAGQTMYLASGVEAKVYSFRAGVDRSAQLHRLNVDVFVQSVHTVGGDVFISGMQVTPEARSSGLYRLDRSAMTLSPVFLSHEHGIETIAGFEVIEDSALAAITDRGLTRLDPASGESEVVLEGSFLAQCGLAARGADVFATAKSGEIVRVDVRTGRSERIVARASPYHIGGVAGDVLIVNDRGGPYAIPLRHSAVTKSKEIGSMLKGVGYPIIDVMVDDTGREWLVSFDEGARRARFLCIDDRSKFSVSVPGCWGVVIVD